VGVVVCTEAMRLGLWGLPLLSQGSSMEQRRHAHLSC
jgi:hypothetical protein